MILGMYTIHDITAEVYTPPFYAINEGSAIRVTRGLTNQPGTHYFDNPEDFRLYQIGDFNDEDCSISLIPERRLVCRLSDLLIPRTNGENNEN